MWKTVITEPRSLERTDIGVLVLGRYGKSYNEDDDALAVDGTEARVVKVVGRPKKNTGESGSEFIWTTALNDIQISWS